MGFLTRVRKSASSSSSSSAANTVYTTSPTSSASDSTSTIDSLSARIVKSLTWSRPRSSDGNNSSTGGSKFPPAPMPAPLPAKKRKQPKKVRHPSERELTEANLRHYEMLSGFRMEFGRTRSRSSFESDVSPMGSRMGSFDFGSATESYVVLETAGR